MARWSNYRIVCTCLPWQMLIHSLVILLKRRQLTSLSIRVPNSETGMTTFIEYKHMNTWWTGKITGSVLKYRLDLQWTVVRALAFGITFICLDLCSRYVNCAFQTAAARFISFTVPLRRSNSVLLNRAKRLDPSNKCEITQKGYQSRRRNVRWTRWSYWCPPQVKTQPRDEPPLIGYLQSGQLMFFCRFIYEENPKMRW